LDVDNNVRLGTFSSPLVNITVGVAIFANGQDLSVDFPNLATAGNMTFRNVSTLSLPSLKTVTGGLTFDECGITSIMAQNLTKVGTGKVGDLAIIGNSKLTNATFPSLASIAGGLHIANNTLLQSVSFAHLATVGGAVDMTGNFTTYVISVVLPSMLTVVSVLRFPTSQMLLVPSTSKAHLILIAALSLNSSLVDRLKDNMHVSRQPRTQQASAPAEPFLAPHRHLLARVQLPHTESTKLLQVYR
jgi:hypothetical protein